MAQSDHLEVLTTVRLLVCAGANQHFWVLLRCEHIAKNYPDTWKEATSMEGSDQINREEKNLDTTSFFMKKKKLRLS